MIFGSQYPHVDVAQPYQLGSLVDFIQRRAVELRETLVQIDYDRLGPRSSERSHSDRILLRSNTQVDISIGSQPAFGVQPSDRPTLDQQRFDPRRPK
jgi:hypothetical protein